MKGLVRDAAAGTERGTGIDLGQEPALTVDPRKGAPQRHAVSIRWLTGAVLTGLTSTILMGGALMAALDGRHQLAVAPEIGRSAKAGSGKSDSADSLGGSQKGDRIRPAREPVSDRQVIQVSTVTRQGDRDLIKMKPFARITTTLATAITDLSADAPRFDPMKLVAAGADAGPPPPAAAPSADKLGVVSDEGASGDGEDGVPVDAADGAIGSGDDIDVAAADAAPPEPTGPEQIYGANVEGEVSVKVTPMPLDMPLAEDEETLSVADAEEAARGLAPAAPATLAAMPYVDPERFSFGDNGPDPFAALGVKIVPENVSFVAKSAPANETEERIITIDKKDDLQSFLTGNGLDPKDADAAAAALGELVDLAGLKSGEKLRVLVSHEGEAVKILRLSLYDQGVHQATIARRDDDSFVRADEPESSTDEFETAEQPDETDNGGPMPTLYSSLYETAREQQIPEPLITELVRILSYDVDFQSRISPGDSLEVFHSLPEAGASDDDDEILYVAITIDGTTKRYYRFRSPDDGVVDYFDEEGRSAKKFLVRKPMNVGIVRSPFGYRRHPILGYVRLHPGVDWAAPRGTPIMAAGNGTVEKAGWASGYGNFTLIRHTNGYETAYGHQSSIARGIRPGVKVRQGQIIGYVGSTGLSTGPHLHYEVRINDKPVDPLRVRLPRGRVLQGEMLAEFDAEKARIDTLLGTPAGSKFASANGDAATN